MYRPNIVNKDKKYYGSPRECRRCGEQVTSFYYETNNKVDEIICFPCRLELNPPKMCITLLKNGNLWNATSFITEENMRLVDFDECGWFIKKEIHYENTKSQRLSEFHMEYYGKARCQRFYDYKYFYEKMPTCLNSGCRKHIPKGTGIFGSNSYMGLLVGNVGPYTKI